MQADQYKQFYGVRHDHTLRERESQAHHPNGDAFRVSEETTQSLMRVSPNVNGEWLKRLLRGDMWVCGINMSTE